jgi:hypothetical protein
MRAIYASSTGADFVSNTITAFPNFGLKSMVDFSAFFLYQLR